MIRISPALLLLAALSAAGCGKSDSAAGDSSTQADVAPASERGALNREGYTSPAGSQGAPAPAVAAPATPPGEKPAPPAALQGDTAAPAAQPMIIRNGTVTVRVDSLEPAIAAVRALAQRLGGYVANTTVNTGAEQTRTASIQLKIPAPRFDDALAGLNPVGRREKAEVTSEDVGEEFVDVTARMNNARRLEDRLLTLLQTRTGKLEDVLAVEHELASVREEIERYEGRLRFLRTRVAVSTLTVELHEPYPTVGDYPGQNPIVQAFSRAWQNFVGFVAGFISALGFLVPLGVLIALAVWLWRRYGPRRRPPPPPAAPGRTTDATPPPAP